MNTFMFVTYFTLFTITNTARCFATAIKFLPAIPTKTEQFIIDAPLC